MKDKTRYTTYPKGFLAISILASLTFPAYGETTIGRWCDKMIPSMPKFNHTMTIVAGIDGKVLLKSKFADGSSEIISELQEMSGGIYKQIGRAAGDKYRIIPNDGSLQLLDNDGLIRVAAPLENTPQSGEC